MALHRRLLFGRPEKELFGGEEFYALAVRLRSTALPPTAGPARPRLSACMLPACGGSGGHFSRPFAPAVGRRRGLERHRPGPRLGQDWRARLPRGKARIGRGARRRAAALVHADRPRAAVRGALRHGSDAGAPTHSQPHSSPRCSSLQVHCDTGARRRHIRRDRGGEQSEPGAHVAQSLHTMQSDGDHDIRRW